MDQQSSVNISPVASQKHSHSAFCFMGTRNVEPLLYSKTPVDQKSDTAQTTQKYS